VKKILAVCFVVMISFAWQTVGADDLTDLEQQLNQTTQQLENAQNEKEKTQSELARLASLKSNYEASLNDLQNNYSTTNSQLSVTKKALTTKAEQLTQTEQDILKIELTISKQQNNLRESVRTMYMISAATISPLIFRNIETNETQSLVYKQAILTRTKDELVGLSEQQQTATEIKNLLVKIKAELETEISDLTTRQKSLVSTISQTQNSLTSAQSQLQNLSQSLAGIDQQISSLTTQQQQILAAKAAAALASTTVGNTELNPALIEQSPPKDGTVYFSFWTYGYPHRVGMNQYGAFGRAQAGQSVAEILRTYYAGTTLETITTPNSITITTAQGDSSIAFEEDYLLGIGEMPSCWGSPDRGGLEALKAQAIAARTYALAYTNNGAQPICTTQACQVYVGSSKVAGACGQYWKQAVEETKGQVILLNGSPITAYYASTAGGFTLNAQEVWGGYRSYTQRVVDTDAQGNAYDGPAHGDSPWYHKAWGNKPWLSVDEVTDLINTALLPTSYDSQINVLTAAEVVAQLNENELTSVTDLTALEILDENDNPGANTAQTKTVRVYFDNGKTINVAASRFKFVFNLRSPGTDAIWTTRFDVVTAAQM